MSLIKCGECGHKVSSNAKSCPSCGAKPPYRPGLGIVIFAILALWFALYNIMPKKSPPPVQKTAAEEAADQRARMAYVLMRKVKESLREPDSLDVITAYSNENADLLCLKYRARNGFGGYSIEYYVIGAFGDRADVSAWNTFCLGEMYDVTNAKNLL